MTVYVDDMRAKFGRLIMCHMIADTDEELHAMAQYIGVARRWWQSPPKHASHYDIALSKRALAIAAGAVPIGQRECAVMVRRRAVTGTLGSPEDALVWYGQWRQELAEKRAQLAQDGQTALVEQPESP